MIQSILQAVICNLFPSDMAYSLVIFFNLVLLLTGIVLFRITTYIFIYTQIVLSFIRSLQERKPLPSKEVWILKWEE